MISTNGVWSVPVLIPYTYRGYDPTVAQNPVTGEIVVAYAKYDTAPSPDWWKASLYITRLNPAYLHYYVDWDEGCQCYVEPYNNYWSVPRLVVSAVWDCLDNYASGCGYADNIVPSIFSVQDSSSAKLMIVYAYGWEAGKYGISRQTARLRIVDSSDGGNTWSGWRLVYDSPNYNYYDSKPSCTGLGSNSHEVLCTFYIRDRSTAYSGYMGNMGIYTIRSADWGITWPTLYEVLPKSSLQHYWPFVLKNGLELFLAYTSKAESTEGDFIIRWAISLDNGYTWIWDRKVSDQAGVTESWPTLARRYDYGGSLYGVTAVWDNFCHVEADCPAGAKLYRSNLHGFDLLSPRGGEYWTIGQYRTILWNDSFTSSTVTLSISRDGYSTWQDIASSVPNTGSYQWSVTGPATSQAYIRVSGGGYSHSSYDNFIIADYYG